AAVFAPFGLLGADDNAGDHVARLHVAPRNRLLDAGLDHIADPSIATPAATKYLDAHTLLGAGVIPHVKVRIHLDHRPPSFARRPDIQTIRCGLARARGTP